MNKNFAKILSGEPLLKVKNLKNFSKIFNNNNKHLPLLHIKL
jgi:hypothetical protein